jgi:hypothetical protein
MAIAVVMPLWFAVTQLFGLTVEDFVMQKKSVSLYSLILSLRQPSNELVIAVR